MNMKMSHFTVRRLIGIFCMVLFLPAIIGCYALSQNRSAPTSGFLKDYSNVKDACDYWAKRVTQRLDDMADGDYLLKGN
jgi:hypothetical protein